jgi:hypothetical protein
MSEYGSQNEQEVNQNQPSLEQWKFTNLVEMYRLCKPILQILKDNNIAYAFAGSVGAFIDPTVEFRNPNDVDIVVPHSEIEKIREVLDGYFERDLRRDTAAEAAEVSHASEAYGRLKLKDEVKQEEYIICDIVADYGYKAFDENGKKRLFLVGIDKEGRMLKAFDKTPGQKIPTKMIEVDGEMAELPYIPLKESLHKYTFGPKEKGDSERAEEATKPRPPVGWQERMERARQPA